MFNIHTWCYIKNVYNHLRNSNHLTIKEKEFDVFFQIRQASSIMLSAKELNALFVSLISHQPAVLFSQNKSAVSNQPIVLFSQNKPAPTTSQPNRL
jgi:hypothetical protein